ncbi:MAG: hypothetical protein CL460_06160 [Acidimicrobiaceae bacterium]|jgi:uncharacterized membrane protein YhaH (DUF805 family)|nr:hypothetical protein [Acidimicrobiaceae bacterium]
MGPVQHAGCWNVRTFMLYRPRVPLVENYIAGLLKYAVFRGRASRAEYWGFAFANLILAGSFWLLGTLGGPLRTLSLLYAVAVLIPNLAITARRLHDVGRSGWWLPLGIVPTPLVFVILFFVCQRGQSEANRYGPPVSK